MGRTFFNNVLNRPAQINEDATACLSRVPTNHERGFSPPAAEVDNVINNKPPAKLQALAPSQKRCTSQVATP